MRADTREWRTSPRYSWLSILKENLNIKLVSEGERLIYLAILSRERKRLRFLSILSKEKNLLRSRVVVLQAYLNIRF